MLDGKGGKKNGSGDFFKIKKLLVKICKKTAFFFFLTSIFPFMQGKQAAEQSLQAFGFLYFLCKEKADAQEPQQNC